MTDIAWHDACAGLTTHDESQPADKERDNTVGDLHSDADSPRHDPYARVLEKMDQTLHAARNLPKGSSERQLMVEEFTRLSALACELKGIAIDPFGECSSLAA